MSGYAAALPAGSYVGSFGAHRPARAAPSNQGATLRNAAMRRTVSLAGLAALGGTNLCTDTGWIATQTILDSGLTLLGGALAPTTTKAEGSTTTSGGGAGYYATEVGGVVTDTWGAVCDAERARNAAEASAENTRLLMDSAAADRATMDRATAEARRSTDIYAQLAMRQPVVPLAAPAATGIDTNTMLIVGGIAAAALVGILILR